MISSILRRRKSGASKNLREVKQVTVEVYKRAKESVAIGEHHWNPDSRETANQSGAYTVAAALMDGTGTLRSFNDAHLWNPELRELLRKVEIVENEQFTRAYERVPVEHRARVTVILHSGERLVGEGRRSSRFGTPERCADRRKSAGALARTIWVRNGEHH